MLRVLVFSVFLVINLFAINTSSMKELSWQSGVSFLSFLEKNKIPVSLFYSLPSEDQELVAEIASGLKYQVMQDADGQMQQILIPVNDEIQIHIFKGKNSEYKMDFIPISYQNENKVLNIEVTHSISQDIYDYTGSTPLAAAFIDALKGEGIDYKRIKKGDKIFIVYSQKIRLGKVFGTPEIEVAMLQTSGRKYVVYRFNDKFYDKSGKEKDRFFLVRPIHNARITSGFTLKRFHPILKRYRAHLGVDYAAPKGTPVRSAGDGVVKFVGTKSGYGKVIIIKHNSEYETLYAHLNGFAKGLKKSQNVKQGKIIGYVGSSGLSTGPHLHLGLYKNQKAINPEKMLSITKSTMSGKNMKLFKQSVEKYNKFIEENEKALTANKSGKIDNYVLLEKKSDYE